MTLLEHVACQRDRGGAKSTYLAEFAREIFSRVCVAANRGSVRVRTPDVARTSGGGSFEPCPLLLANEECPQ